MCGITGFLTRDAHMMANASSLVARMASAIEHRGPDDAGVWVSADAGIALGHRRLSIIDVSPAGHQPMASHGGRYVIAYNGEIYNHLELRRELEGVCAAPAWRGHSDTETVLAAFERWGVEAALPRLAGMFAMAIWDKRDRTLFLARDRFGEKPLYYGWIRAGFVFGSELKALRAYPGFENPICREALAQYFRFMYVPAPHSIYRGVYKLEPGCLLRVTESASGAPPDAPLRPPATYGGISVQRWWSMAATVEAGVTRPFADEGEALHQLEASLSEAVQGQSLADVPLGAFLSGGVDSSTIVALMQKQSMRRVKTFTVGLEEMGSDEAPYAHAVAQHLGTDHTELTVTAKEAFDLVPRLPVIYDEPFADSSQIPTHLVCRAARQQVTVALSGDAGDEIFGGYNRYFWGPSIWRRLSWLPYHLRATVLAGITAVPSSSWDAVGAFLNTLRRGSHGVQHLGDKAHKLATRLRHVRSADDLYLSLVSEWQPPGSIVLGDRIDASQGPANRLRDSLPIEGVHDERLRMMYWDTITYLPDDILCKVDRAAMAISLETRAPFLDHRVADVAWRLPLGMKIRGTQGKWALRQILFQYVPRELIERPKVGFGIPIGEWLRGPLREWAEDLLDEARIQEEGYLDHRAVRATWAEHLGGHRDWTHRIWSVLMFEAWLQAAAPAADLDLRHS